jgi:type VI protein secretion system component VasF
MKVEMHKPHLARDVESQPRHKTGRGVRAMTVMLVLAVLALVIVALMLVTGALESRTETLAERIETPELPHVLPDAPPAPGPVVADPVPAPR